MLGVARSTSFQTQRVKISLLFRSETFQQVHSSIIDRWTDNLNNRENALEIVLELIELNKHARKYNIDVEFCARGTVFFTTSKGYMGKGPIHAQPRDTKC